MENFLVGIILIVTGVAMIRYRYQIYHFTGEWSWAQQYLWGNGTVVAISLIGAGLIFVGVAFPFGVFERQSLTPSTMPTMTESATSSTR